METMFDFKATQVAAPDLGASIATADQATVSDLSTKIAAMNSELATKDATLRTQDIQQELQSTYSAGGKLPEEASLDAQIKAQNKLLEDKLKQEEADKAELKAMVDTATGDDDYNTLQKNLSGLSAGDKLKAIDENKKNLVKMLQDGKISKEYYKAFTGKLDGSRGDAVKEHDKDVNRNIVATTAKMGHTLDTPEKIASYQALMGRNGASADTQKIIPLVAGISGVTNKADQVLADKNSSASDKENARTALQGYITRVETELAASDVSVESQKILTDSLNNAKDKLKAIGETVKTQAAGNILSAQGDGTLQGSYTAIPADSDFMLMNDNDPVKAYEDKQKFLKAKASMDQGRQYLANPDAVNPSSLNDLAKENPTFNAALADKISGEILERQRLGDVAGINRLAIGYPQGAKVIGSHISKSISDHSNYNDKENYAANKQALAVKYKTVATMASGANGQTAVTSMFGSDQGTKLMVINDLANTMTGGDYLAATAKYEEGLKKGLVTKISDDKVNKIIEEGLAGNPNKPAIMKSVTYLNTLSPTGLTEEMAQGLVDRANGNIHTDEATNIKMHSTGGVLVKGTEGVMAGYVKANVPNATHVEIGANEITVYDANGPATVINAKAWADTTIAAQKQLKSKAIREGQTPDMVRDIGNPILQTIYDVGSPVVGKLVNLARSPYDVGKAILSPIGKGIDEALNDTSEAQKTYDYYRQEARHLRLAKDSKSTYRDYNNNKADMLDLEADRIATERLGRKELTINGKTTILK